MADERHDGPADGGNGGPVTPGAEPLGSGGRDSRGNGAGNGTAPGGPRRGHHPGTVALPEQDEQLEPEQERRPERDVRRTRTSGLWVAFTLSALVLLFLLIFILQNNVPTEIKFLGIRGELPVGVALLFASVLGILLVAIPGYLRILQLRRAARRQRTR
jgi:uncharacterized integral membrane protein